MALNVLHFDTELLTYKVCGECKNSVVNICKCGFCNIASFFIASDGEIMKIVF